MTQHFFKIFKIRNIFFKYVRRSNLPQINKSKKQTNKFFKLTINLKIFFKKLFYEFKIFLNEIKFN